MPSNLITVSRARCMAVAAISVAAVALGSVGSPEVLQASATGLQPKSPYVPGLSDNPDGSGNVESLALFMTNPAGSAIVNAIGQIRQVVVPGTSNAEDKRRYLVIAPKSQVSRVRLFRFKRSKRSRFARSKCMQPPE